MLAVIGRRYCSARLPGSIPTCHDDPVSPELSRQDVLWLQLQGKVANPFLFGRGVTYVSSFRACLEDARLATGRNLVTGDVEDELKTGNWLGAVGYMTLLDQIGACFGRPGVTDRDGRPIVRCLSHWAPEVDDRERLALYALRCALAHDYSLLNWHSDQRLQHHFKLDQAIDGPVVQLPGKRWSGELSDMRPQNANVCEPAELRRPCRVNS